MDTTPYPLALAALHHWAAVADGAPPPAGDSLLRRTAWLTAGTEPPAGDAWPGLLAGPLASIFSRVRPRAGAPPAATLRPASLRLQRELLFPVVGAAATGDAVDGLRAAMEALKARQLSPAPALEALLFALQRHAWALPSPLAGVSRYDFARTHAALAAALAANPADDVCLVGGDLSGVQEFIYSVSAKGATKQLRGRSLYLQLLTDACAHAVLDATGMPLCNLLYAGGGRFYLLAPGAARARVPELRQQIGRLLLKAHHGALYLALGAEPFSPGRYNAATWQALNEQIDRDKRHRFASLDAVEFASLFDPQQPPPPRVEADEEEQLDPMGVSLEELGGRLQRASMLSVQLGKPYALDDGQHTYHNVLGALGLCAQLLGDDNAYCPDPARRRLLALDDDAQLEGVRLGPDDLIGTRYTAAEAPTATARDLEEYARLDRARQDDQELRLGQVTPFNLLAAQSEGVARLGVLRMDVDDLGELFGTGLDRPDGIAALAVTAALSAALGRFFEGWVGELCRMQNGAGRGGVIAVYSGGDDLFLVGSWDRMPGLARQIREDFAAYVLGRELQDGEAPLISLSAGITLIGAGYPLYQAADDAAEALDLAKRHMRADSRRKDAVTFLGRTLGWEQFSEAERICTELKGLVDAGVPRALLMTIQQLDASAHQARRHTRTGERQFAYGPWVWQGAYQLTRMAERAQGEASDTIKDLCERILGAEGVRKRTIERAGLAARWAQLLIRDRSSQKEER